eukprot:SAG22_NODE_12596_length_436_cov_2.041543_1_plen_33_part_10
MILRRAALILALGSPASGWVLPPPPPSPPRPPP